MAKRLDGKVALVTGAASGLGAAICEAYAGEGAIVIGTDLKSQEASKPFTHFLQLDVTESSQWEAAIAEIVQLAERLDIVVNCAGLAPHGDSVKPVWEADEKVWNLINNVNSTGVFLGCKYGAKQMIKQEPHESGDRGWIINLASICGQIACPSIVSYVASKHACVGITKAAALDCAPHRVHVNALCPGFVNTPMTKDIFESPEQTAWIESVHPFRGQGRPDDIAKAAVFLASPENTWMTGSLMTVDGGYTAR